MLTVLVQTVLLLLLFVTSAEAGNESISSGSRKLKYLNVIFLIDWVGQSYFYGPLMGSASALAVKAIEKRNLLPGYSLENWSFVDTRCSSLRCSNLIKTWESLPSGRLHGIIGPSCSSCMTYSTVASAFNVPQVVRILHFCH
jgi:hypothetical protein